MAKDTPALSGSTLLSPQVTIGDKVVDVAEIVVACQALSGLSATDWNDLSEQDRDKRLSGYVEAQDAAWRAAHGSTASYVPDPAKPGNVLVRVKQKLFVQHPLGEKRPKGDEPFVTLDLGSNSVPKWAADEDIVQDSLEK